jgi:tRNA dimethylallyltransferase
MVAHGLVEEVARLAQVGLTAESTAGQAIGYKEVLGALAGRCTLDEALDQVRLRSRRYAKRQLSWFRRDARVRWIDLDETDLEGACALVVGSLAEKENTHGAL